ncbi:MAG: EpsG family protein [Muribaculaceae bacterium]|nr:EpsG family protein [Muribaculaceae bacterium]
MLFVGLSDMFGGYDRYIYGEVFDRLADAITFDDDTQIIFLMNHFEVGYSLLSYLIGLITENRYIYIFIITALIYFFIYKSFVRSMDNYPIALIVFLGLTFFFTFTYLRQILACSIAWFGVRYIVDKKWLKFILVGIIVATLHKSGIILMGLAILPLKKWPPASVVFILMICALVGLSGIMGTFYEAFTDVSDFRNQYSTHNEMRLAYLLEVVFFVWIILINYNKIPITRKNLVFLNVSWSFCAILLLFIKSSEGGRLTWYFMIGIIYILSHICTYRKPSLSISATQLINKNQHLLNFLVVILMLGLYLRVYSGWQASYSLYPYKTFLSNGYRPEDIYRIYYEYDFTYDIDKFYRPAFRFLE